MSTTALVQRVFCEIPDCTKHYKSRANMLHHVRTHHKSGDVHSPRGSFPPANPARVLFDNDYNSSTQGNSRGEVNSPKVLSIMSCQCGVCNIIFDSNQDAILHMNEIHKKNYFLPPSPASNPASVSTTAPASTPTPGPHSSQ